MRLPLLLLAASWLIVASFAPTVHAAEPAKDNPHLYVWPMLRGCTADPELQRAVETALRRNAYPVTVLHPPSDQLGCEGEACAQFFKARCAPGSFSAIVGGRGESRGKWTVYSLWLHDLATGKTAFLDHYCPGCDLGQKLADSAQLLVERPAWGPHPTPPFCLSPEAQTKPSLPPIQRVHFIAFGEGRHKSAIADALESAIRPTGIKPVPITLHVRDYNSPELRTRLVSAGQPDQILLAEVLQDGKVELTLYDARVGSAETHSIECPACDKDELAKKVAIATGLLLDRCKGVQCGAPPMSAPAPAEVCTPFQACRSFASSSASSVTGSTSSVQARHHRILTGLSWGLFGASAATSAVLFGLNQTAAGAQQGFGLEASNRLAPAGWTAAGFAVLSLGVAIPATRWLDRSSASSSKNETAFVCPQ